MSVFGSQHKRGETVDKLEIQESNSGSYIEIQLFEKDRGETVKSTLILTHYWAQDLIAGTMLGEAEWYVAGKRADNQIYYFESDYADFGRGRYSLGDVAGLVVTCLGHEIKFEPIYVPGSFGEVISVKSFPRDYVHECHYLTHYP